MAQTALYRHWSDDGRLLYVGISINTVVRLSQHRDKPWFADVAVVTREWFRSREEAHAAERKAIREENPLHNRQRYSELVPVPPSDEPATLAPLGTVRLSDGERERVIDMVCHPNFPFDTLDGIAANLGTDVDYLSRFVVLPKGGTRACGYDDLFSLAERVCRGALASEEPWRIGSPLPAHITGGPVKAKRGRPATRTPEAAAL